MPDFAWSQADRRAEIAPVGMIMEVFHSESPLFLVQGWVCSLHIVYPVTVCGPYLEDWNSHWKGMEMILNLLSRSYSVFLSLYADGAEVQHTLPASLQILFLASENQASQLHRGWYPLCNSLRQCQVIVKTQKTQPHLGRKATNCWKG